MGFGPTLKLTPEEVCEVSEALAALNAADLLSRYDADEMQRQEPMLWVFIQTHALPHLCFQLGQAGVGAFCSIRCLAFSSAQNSAGILVFIDV